MTEEPLYPFGFGLSYTQFTYSDIKLSATSIKKDQTINASVTVTNTGKVESEEVVQLYLSDVEASVPVPLFALKGIKRVKLTAGSSTTVSFSITPEMYAMIDTQGSSIVEKGKFQVSVGGSLPGSRSENLGCAKPAQAIFTVK
jgi:beta-glucosidase